MPQLKDVALAVGFDEVTTYGNSGNVVFDTDRRADDAAAALEAALEEMCGRPVPVIIRSPAEMADAAKRALAWAPSDVASNSLQIGFCRTAPDADALADAPLTAVAPDIAQIDGRELLLLYPNGQGRSKMTATWLARYVGTDVTVRSIGVTQKLACL